MGVERRNKGSVLFHITCMLMPLIPPFQVFQKRFDGSVDFYRVFNEYENGFGSVYGEFWLGMYYIKFFLA